MRILTNNDVVFIKGETIERGKWENDPTMETYRIKYGNAYQYAIIADFGLHEVDSLPEDYEPNKYCYTESDGFYLNPSYEEPVSEKYTSGYDQAVLDMIESGVL